MFDTTIQVARMEVLLENDNLQLVAVLGLVVPIQQGGQIQQALIPAGVIRIPLGREAALETAKVLQENAEKLPKPSDLVVAQPGDVDRIAKVDKAIKNTTKKAQ
jgi:hypothetical protein